MNEETSFFWTIHLDYSIIGIVFAPSYDWDFLSVYVAVSRDYPQMVWPFFGAAIGLDWCGMCHLPDCDDFSTKFLWENHSLSLPAWPGLDGSSLFFIIPTW